MIEERDVEIKAQKALIDEKDEIIQIQNHTIDNQPPDPSKNTGSTHAAFFILYLYLFS